MALIETDGLVLKSYNLAEADKIIVFLTKDHGVIRGVAKGAKRLKSRFGSSLEPFSCVRVTYFQKVSVELVSIQKVELLRSSFTQASDPEFLRKFSYFSDLLVSMLPPHDPSELLFRMFGACLATALPEPRSYTAVGVYFELWLLRLAGYLPDWSRCNRCGRQFEPAVELVLGPDFHITCAKCAHRRADLTISSGERELAAMALVLSPREFYLESSAREEELKGLSVTFKRMISQTIGRDIQSNL